MCDIQPEKGILSVTEISRGFDEGINPENPEKHEDSDQSIKLTL